MSPSERLAKRSATVLERRSSRRGFLARAALVASAIAVGPVRYLVRPMSAWAVIRPGNCSSGSRCNDGWTSFCCTVNGGENSCPPWSFIAGWWKCTHYSGRRLCGAQNVRYYVDCNVKPGQSAPDGCHCAHGSCGERRVACNVFRYGQCNTQVGGVTAVGCRIVTCANPATIPGFNCNGTQMIENAVCGHDVGCLSERNARIIGRNPGA
jgi:hypothetical protein